MCNVWGHIASWDWKVILGKGSCYRSWQFYFLFCVIFWSGIKVAWRKWKVSMYCILLWIVECVGCCHFYSHFHDFIFTAIFQKNIGYQVPLDFPTLVPGPRFAVYYVQFPQTRTMWSIKLCYQICKHVCRVTLIPVCRLHHCAKHKMQQVITSVVWSVCVCWTQLWHLKFLNFKNPRWQLKQLNCQATGYASQHKSVPVPSQDKLGGLCGRKGIRCNMVGWGWGHR